MDGCLGGCLDGWMDGSMDGWMGGSIDDPCREKALHFICCLRRMKCYIMWANVRDTCI